MWVRLSTGFPPEPGHPLGVMSKDLGQDLQIYNAGQLGVTGTVDLSPPTFAEPFRDAVTRGASTNQRQFPESSPA